MPSLDTPSLLGGGELKYEQTDDALIVRLPEGYSSDYPTVIKVAID